MALCTLNFFYYIRSFNFFSANIQRLILCISADHFVHQFFDTVSHLPVKIVPETTYQRCGTLNHTHSLIRIPVQMHNSNTRKLIFNPRKPAEPRQPRLFSGSNTSLSFVPWRFGCFRSVQFKHTLLVSLWLNGRHFRQRNKATSRAFKYYSSVKRMTLAGIAKKYAFGSTIMWAKIKR